MTEAQEKATVLMKEIEWLCIKMGLNLTIYDGGIGFIDPKEKKIVMVWHPGYHMDVECRNVDTKTGNEYVVLERRNHYIVGHNGWKIVKCEECGEECFKKPEDPKGRYICSLCADKKAEEQQ